MRVLIYKNQYVLPFFIARALHRRKARCAKIERTTGRSKRSEKVERVKFAAYIGRRKIPGNVTDAACVCHPQRWQKFESWVSRECSSFVPLSRAQLFIKRARRLSPFAFSPCSREKEKARESQRI